MEVVEVPFALQQTPLTLAGAETAATVSTKAPVTDEEEGSFTSPAKSFAEPVE